MSTVSITRPSNGIPPILKQPQHDLDKMKTPSQLKSEREANISNEKVEKIAKEATDNVYKMLQKTFANTQYNVSFQVENGANKQFKLTQKTTGKTLVELPPDIAVQVAEKAKRTSIGLILDYTA